MSHDGQVTGERKESRGPKIT
uniref:Uncharacterized protein n=1 Tax=Rhizophora mucronata TaxID=61149 RepID=A0A2P2PQY5_RHIMU